MLHLPTSCQHGGQLLPYMHVSTEVETDSRCRVTGTIVACSSSVRVIGCLNLRTPPPCPTLVAHLEDKVGTKDPTSADACGEVTGCVAGCQAVGMCSTRGGSRGNVHYIVSTKKQIRQKTIWLLNPEIQNRGYQWPQKLICPISLIILTLD